MRQRPDEKLGKVKLKVLRQHTKRGQRDGRVLIIEQYRGLSGVLIIDRQLATECV